MRLNQAQIASQVATLRHWNQRGKRIWRTFVFDDFIQGLRFVNRVARLAEAINHHPDISFRYNKVRLSLTTHDESGLTIKDFKLARKINRLTKD
jgi:4a-hydroxytetrahydrobiopterin dehydratase